jgi:hypothetical protein
MWRGYRSELTDAQRKIIRPFIPVNLVDRPPEVEMRGKKITGRKRHIISVVSFGLPVVVSITEAPADDGAIPLRSWGIRLQRIARLERLWSTRTYRNDPPERLGRVERGAELSRFGGANQRLGSPHELSLALGVVTDVRLRCMETQA